ncbi:MAG: ATP-binding protein [Turicibacter sp.]|nr:ATP-binding protein [Turicibacter sp.]
MYIKRQAEADFLEMSRFFKVVLVTGARQVGKTTMLKHLADGDDRTYVSLDDDLARTLARQDPRLFFQQYKLPIIIDEVQNAPELFPEIKRIVDESDEYGRIWLTGSQHFNMMKNVQESLAGRIGILKMYSFSKQEADGIEFSSSLDFSFENLQDRQKETKPTDIQDIFDYIWTGGMPRAIEMPDNIRKTYFDAYTNTYLLRDVVDLGGVSDGTKFVRFLRACAALTSEQVNYKTLADTSDISSHTAKKWLSLLEGMGIVYLLQPYANNELKRLAKAPKLYFLDTGYCAALSMWPSKETMMTGPVGGKYFENYVIAELVRELEYGGNQANLTYYRDANAKEIDVFIERGQEIHPLEIKLSASPRRQEVQKFSIIEKTKFNQSFGGIICMTSEPYMIDEKNSMIPANLI